MNSSGDTVQVYVQVTRVHWASFLNYNYRETDCSFVFLDSTGTVLYRINYPPLEGSDHLEILPAQLVIPFGRPVILILRASYPSAPGSGLDGQLFDTDEFDNIIPITNIMYTSENRLKPPVFRPVLIDRDGTVKHSLRSSNPFALPWIETKDWTGNFTVLIYNRIRRYHQFPFARIPEYRVEIDTVEAARERKRQGKEDALVTIYSNPEKMQSSSRSIRLRPTSSIRFLDAVSRDGWWLHVVIDGIDGYVTQPDFSKLGLPDAG